MERIAPKKLNPEELLALQLSKQEQKRTIYWNNFDPFIDFRTTWRASMMRHLFNILPGQKILEIGAGNGKFTKALDAATRSECEITAVVFNPEFENRVKRELIRHNIHVTYLDSFPGKLKGEKFDYIIAFHMLENKTRDQFLFTVKSLIKPGGGLLLFEPNPWNPYYRMRNIIRRILPLDWKRPGDPISLNRLQVFSVLSEIGFTQINAFPYDFLYPPIPGVLLWPMKHLSLIMENFPYMRNFAGSLYIWAFNPAPENYKPLYMDLCEHDMFFEKVSFVIPCHNEEMNIVPLIRGLQGYYNQYIFQIIIVDDNSSDRTAEIAEELAEKDERICVVKRLPPNGVGRALRDGLREAQGEYVLIMDSDFQRIIPEFRDLFGAIASGADVAVGSRFSRESVLINYAFTKILANRAFHVLSNLLLGKHFRDISNNLKVFRREVAKRLVIEAHDFSANAETGLKPILLGYRVVEVPISWIDRSLNMGFSTFRILTTGPNYFRVLVRLVWMRIKTSITRLRSIYPARNKK